MSCKWGGAWIGSSYVDDNTYVDKEFVERVVRHVKVFEHPEDEVEDPNFHVHDRVDKFSFIVYRYIAGEKEGKYMCYIYKNSKFKTAKLECEYPIPWSILGCSTNIRAPSSTVIEASFAAQPPVLPPPPPIVAGNRDRIQVVCPFTGRLVSRRYASII